MFAFVWQIYASYIRTRTHTYSYNLHARTHARMRARAHTHTGSVGLSNVSIYRLFNVTWQVRIILLDINDNSPTILTNPSALLGTVGEDAAQDTFIISLEATDPDEGRNGTVIFSLTSGTRKVVLWTVRRDDEIIIIFFFFSWEMLYVKIGMCVNILISQYCLD